MRNPTRIGELTALLQLIWEKQPDTRFNQLIHNLQYEFAEHTNRQYVELYEREEIKAIKGAVAFRPISVVDLYNVEDNEFIEFLKNKLTNT